MINLLGNLILVAKTEFEKKFKPISAKEQLLIMFNLLHKIEGRTKIQKIVFIAQKEYTIFQDLNFDLHYYGPYSEELTKLLTLLEKEELIKIIIESKGFKFDNEEITQYNYLLSSKGQTYCNNLIKNIPQYYLDILPNLLSLNSMDLNTLKHNAYSIWFSSSLSQ